MPKDMSKPKTSMESMKWSSMKPVDKENMRKKVKEWLHINYVPSGSSCLPRMCVYEHFKAKKNKEFDIVSDAAIFGRLVAYAFPHVKFRRLGKRGESKYYYHGIDVREGNAHAKRLYNERIQSDKDLDIADAKGLVHEDKVDLSDITSDRNGDIESQNLILNAEPDEICSCTGDCKKCRVNWTNFSANLKESHIEWLKQWLEQEYQVWPQVCLLRQSVFDHYREHCVKTNQTPATPAIFGKMLFKNFKRLTMRRLGARGLSRYYYMGIDIRSESADYEKVTDGRTFCPTGKPKFSRAFNGAPRR